MLDQRKARLRRLSIWLALNFTIFTVCYLNYRFQLKHRYLYRTLSVGLCFSRAAAMVINFNLLLVWIPMCKYTLTRLSYVANKALAIQKRRLQLIVSCLGCNDSHRRAENHHANQSAKTLALIANSSTKSHTLHHETFGPHLNDLRPADSLTGRLVGKLRSCLGQVVLRFRHRLTNAKINYIKSFLVAVDHCTSLHTICATTITLASIVHTVAHLMNVINFSKNFDPLLSTLNMAQYKGQNPFELLVSVPGITGCLMIIILLLMSLSSMDIIRNSSFDLFQIFHRLSVLFVILLIIHPSSHVLKEQANVTQHHPDHCHPNDLSHHHMSNHTQLYSRTKPSIPSDRRHIAPRGIEHNLRAESSISNHRRIYANQTHRDDRLRLPNGLAPRQSLAELCLDRLPVFVAQNTICWYVLGFGLSCYLFDLLLRRLRRSRTTIRLLNVRSDDEGNLIELIMSSNHKRFANWLPGQFVYLNCPQIALYEWHPFTISSMDYQVNQFTLHIKTGGDWTRKLRQELEVRLDQTNPVDQHEELGSERSLQALNNKMESMSYKRNDGFHCSIIDLSYKQIEAMAKSEGTDRDSQHRNDHTRAINHPSRFFSQHQSINNHRLGDLSLDGSPRKSAKYLGLENLELFIDGPFHSPFERLLEQEVSVCIANGVGWTAFSSVFQSLSHKFIRDQSSRAGLNDWWSKWQNYAYKAGNKSSRQTNRSSSSRTNVMTTGDTCHGFAARFDHSASTQPNLHLLIIVTTIEQLKPFYNIASKYFNCLGCQHSDDHSMDSYGPDLMSSPVREVMAYVTRSSLEDGDVREFRHQERLEQASESPNGCSIRVNKLFSIHFGKPNFETYLGGFTQSYHDKNKISVYCCGSYQVKKAIKEICHNMNNSSSRHKANSCLDTRIGPTISYHEENF